MQDSIVLNNGGVLIYPTDTIWGIGCDALNINAIERVKSIKGRDNSKSLILLVRDIDMLRQYVETIPKKAMQLLESSLSPTTIIYPKAKNLPIEHLSFNSSIGIRIPKNDYLQEVFKEFDHPIVSTSANYSGQPSPLTFEDIDKRLLSEVDYVSTYNHKTDNHSKGSSIYLINEQDNIIKLR